MVSITGRPGRGAELIDAVRGAARPLRTTRDLDPLLDRIGDSRFVLLGEASHGTSEYYRWRTVITRRLIEEKGFDCVAVEGDWPDCYRLNRYVRGYPGAGENALEVLGGIERWPSWMWANYEVEELAEWMRGHNRGLPPERRIGFYGLDVYSLWESMEAVIGFLERSDARAAQAARAAYRCFEPYGRDEQRYARATMLVPASCEDEVVSVLTMLRKRGEQFPDDLEATFSAEQNARIAVEAERYYRAMVRGSVLSWNVRDLHMADTLDRLVELHAKLRGRDEVKAVVWAHNTHIGDARQTDMAADGMYNIGQIVRERHGKEGVVLVGFSGHRGSVIAGREWGAPAERLPVPPGQSGSWEDVLHAAGAEDKLLLTDVLAENPAANEWRGHRAVGVVYNPEYERLGNYVPSVLPKRYDALLYIDQTEALHPIHTEHPRRGEVPETYPTGV